MDTESGEVDHPGCTWGKGHRPAIPEPSRRLFEDDTKRHRRIVYVTEWKGQRAPYLHIDSCVYWYRSRVHGWETVALGNHRINLTEWQIICGDYQIPAY